MAVKEEVKKVERKLYRLIFGKHTGFDEDGNAKSFRQGDKVALSEGEYEAFKDKFEPVKGGNADKEAASAPNVTPTQPQQDSKDPAPTDKAPKAEETKPSDGAKGAGAAANSSNTAKV